MSAPQMLDKIYLTFAGAFLVSDIHKKTSYEL